jgi:hypothetical protein
MEKGAKAIAYLFLGALLLGLLVVVVHPAYRRSAVSMMRGQPESAPLWESNRTYYESITLTPTGERRHAE